MYKHKNYFLEINIILITLIMIIARFLLNEKGRVSPDSIRYMRQAEIFPIIDNTTAPLGYPLLIRSFTFWGIDEFWASKMIGILCFIIIVWIAYKKRFYFKEIVAIGGLFSFVSIFSFTLSESFMLVIELLFFYLSSRIILGKYKFTKGVFLLSICLIFMFNIRYVALFFIGFCCMYGLYYYKRKYGKTFLFSGIIGLLYIVAYKFLFIDYFNENYIHTFLNIGIHSTPKLLTELWQGLFTTFNPFIHITDPNGGLLNIAIYGIGGITILIILFILKVTILSKTEVFLLLSGVFGIICSFFIQYFYSVDHLNYRLLAPFSLPIWMVFLKKLYQYFQSKIYLITALSLCSGLLFTILSKGIYLENREKMNQFLIQENLKNKPLKFYMETEEDLESMQITELISTIQPNIYVTFNPKDSLQKTTLTRYKVVSKTSIDRNKFQ